MKKNIIICILVILLVFAFLLRPEPEILVEPCEELLVDPSLGNVDPVPSDVMPTIAF